MQVAKPALIVYAFARREMLGAAERDYLQHLWNACAQLGMTAPVPDVHPSVEFPNDFGTPSPAFQPLAAHIHPAPPQESAYYQAFLFGYYDVVGLIACLAPNAENDTLERWGRLYAEWRDAVGSFALPEGVLGEAYLFLAHTPLPPEALPALSEAVAASLPTELPERTSYLTEQGFCLWEGVPVQEWRVFALLATETADDALTAWTLWYTREQLAPFARCLIHAAKIRYEEQIYLRDLPALNAQRQRVDEALEALLRQHQRYEADDYVRIEELIRAQSELSRAQADAAGLLMSLSRLKELRATLHIAQRNLSALIPPPHPCAPAPNRSPFDADLARAEWLLNQSEYDLEYLSAVRERAQEAHQLTQLLLEQARERTAHRQNALSLLQTTLLGALLTALTAIQALQTRLPLPDALHPPVVACMAALALALPPLLLRWREPYQRIDYLFGSLLGATLGWLTLALYYQGQSGASPPLAQVLLANLTGALLALPLLYGLNWAQTRSRGFQQDRFWVY